MTDLHRLWEALHRPVIDDSLARSAGQLALDHALSGYDAIHLAAALASTDTLVAADRRLLEAAHASGLAIADVAA